MKNFRQLVNELPSRKIVFTFGRFQPPTVGHELLVKAVQRVAKAQNADHVIYTSRTQDKKKNPLDVTRKVYYLKRMFPKANIVGAGETTRTFIEVAKELNKRYKQIVMVAGSDRVTEYNRILNEYNGKEFNFETIQVVSAGERDPDADDASGMSGTKMRDLAKKGNFNTFKKGLPSTLTTTDARRLMNDIRSGLGMEELKEEVKFETDLLREMYHKGDIFLVGQIVESKGQTFEIVDRGANYLSVVDKSGNISKKWLSDVKMVKTIMEDYTEGHMGTTNQVSYKGYTTKNFDHERGAVDAFLHTIAKNKDPVATLNALKATDSWLGIVKKALDTDTYTKQDSRDFYTNLTKAQDALNNMDEFLHHLDYFNNRVHDMQRIAAQYHTDTDEQGQESYIPTGELLEMKFMSGDKIKVARIIATTLGVSDVEKVSSPTQLVNAGLRLIRNKPMRAEYLDVIKKMLQTAKDAGIDYEESLLPSKAKEVKESFKQFLTKEAADEISTADTKLDKRGRRHPAHKIVFNPSEVEYQKKDVKESAPAAPSIGVHRISVTVSEPDHPMVSKRKETTQKFVRVPTSSKERAIEQGKKHFQKKGFKVHDANHVSMVYEEVDSAAKEVVKTNLAAKHAREKESLASKHGRERDQIKEVTVVTKDPVAPKLVQDRKTGKMYDPQKKFSDLMAQPKIQAVFKRLAKEEVELNEDAYAKSEENKRSADSAKKQGNMFDYHMHMSDHHDNLSQHNSKKGRSSVADSHAAKSEEHHDKAMKLKEEVEQIDEISSKLAGDYYGAATKKHIDKVGIKPNMYGRIEKDMGKKRAAGVDRAIDRITGARKTNEEVELDEATPYYNKPSFLKKMSSAAKQERLAREKKEKESKPVKEASVGAGELNLHRKSMFPESRALIRDPESEKPKLGHDSKPEGTIGHANVAKETSDTIQPQTQTGHSFSGNEGLRRRKAYHKMHEEVTEKNLDSIEDDEDSFNDEIEKITDPEHIMHLYDDEEFFDDEDDGDTEDEDEDDKDEDDEKEVNEAIGRVERMKRGIRFKRTAAKRERLKGIALKRMSSSSVIQRRARRHAVIMMKKRLARKPLDTLSTQEKERLETFIQKRKALITRLATRIAPKIRKIEKDRLQKRKSN